MKISVSFQNKDVIGPSHASLFVLFLCIVLLIPVVTTAQQKHLVQIKAFDEQLRPVKSIEISINGKEYIAIGEKASAFAELNDDDLELKSVKVKNTEYEVASWNYSKGVVEIIVRKKNYRIVPYVVRDKSNIALPNIKVTFMGEKILSVTTNLEGRFEIPQPIDGNVTLDQFDCDGYRIIKLNHSEKENTLVLEKKIVAQLSNAGKKNQKRDYFKNFNLSKLDSIQSLTVFLCDFQKFPNERFE